ncbi:MAG: halogenase, partial [Gammaproteobacteria bacterium]|nr:halogenase [Gemmatimonadota bacterium]NIR35907.1 halogenase [Actinomycetota bacterium]NIU73746.1 halogenase [Gammaproteobacteria bacterium]NIY08103.1 halogenase [Gemmatimonadota bacterium]
FGDRFEIGPLHPRICEMEGGRFRGLPLRTHQVDRGRLENELARRCERAGVAQRPGTRVDEVRVGDAGHTVLMSGDHGGELSARWVVVASGGRSAGLAIERRSLDHRVRAAWTRVEGDLDVGSWSTDPGYAGRTLDGLRRFSTNHLMGPGYWAWVIPLPTGVTSVGVVTAPDTSAAPPRDYAELLDWLRPRDPRLAAALADTRPVHDDFHTADLDAFRADRCFHPHRTAVIGQAAAAVDVLYSPGGDLIAVGNTLLADLIERDLAGERIAGRCAVADRVFGGFADGLADVYRGQYRHFGSPSFVATKVTWDSALYFGYHTLLFRHGLFGDPDFLTAVAPEVRAVQGLQARVQGRLRDGNFVPLVDASAGAVEWGAIDWLMAP